MKILPHRRWHRRAAGLLALAGVLLGSASPAGAITPQMQTSSNRIIFSVTGGPEYVVRGTSPTYQLRAQAKHQHRLQQAWITGSCATDLGTVPKGESRDAACTLANVQPGARLTVRLTGTSHKFNGLWWQAPESESLELDQALQVIDPRLTVEVLPTSTWFSGLQLSVPVRVSNTGDVGLKDLEFSFGSSSGASCPGVPNALAEGASIEVTCALNSPQNPSNPVQVGVTAKGRPDLWGEVHPRDFKAIASVQRTFNAIPANPDVDVTIYDQKPSGWSFGTEVRPSITVTNLSGAPARLSTTSPSGHHTCGRTDLGIVPAGGSRTYSCEIFSPQAFGLRIQATARIMDGLVATSLTATKEAFRAVAINPLLVTIGAPGASNQVAVSVTNLAAPIGGNQAWNLSFTMLPGCTNAGLVHPSILTTSTYTFTCTVPANATQIQARITGIYGGTPFTSTTTRLLTGQPPSSGPSGPSS